MKQKMIDSDELYEELQIQGYCKNEYMIKYVTLIVSNQDTEKQLHVTQQHHIVPQHNYKHDSDSSYFNSVVNLKASEHALAHLYLYKCSSSLESEYAELAAVRYIIHNHEFPLEEVSFIEKLPEYQESIERYLILNSELQKGKRTGSANHFYGKHHDEATRAKMRERSPHLSGKDHPMYGKHHSEQSKDAMRRASTGRKKTPEEIQKRHASMIAHGGYGWWITDEYRSKLSKSLTGRSRNIKGYIHVTNDIEDHMIPESQLDEYISKGYRRGRKKFSEDACRNISEGHKGQQTSLGMIWVTNDITDHLISPEDIDKYVEQGYRRGRSKLK